MPGLNQFDIGGIGVSGDPFRALVSSALPPPTTPLAALDMTCGPPLTNVSQGSAVLEVGATQPVLVLITLADIATGAAVDPTQDPTRYSVFLAITQGDPLLTDWLAATWLPRVADPDPGDYAWVLAGPGGSIAPGTGHWRVYAQVIAGGETLIDRSSGYLIVE